MKIAAPPSIRVTAAEPVECANSGDRSICRGQAERLGLQHCYEIRTDLEAQLNHTAEFDILGRVYAIERIGAATKVTVVSNCRRPDKDGRWAEAPHWNNVTLFAKHLQDYAASSVRKGDEVRARGNLANAKYQNAKGETVYTVNLICDEISVGARAADVGEQGS